jgi:hypothetical protein
MISYEMVLRFVKEAVPQLQDYLLSNELYWPLSGSLPRLTPGSLLLELAKLRVAVKDRGAGTISSVEVQRLDTQVETIRSKWRIAWEKKVAREVTNRMRLWSQFLSDYIKAPDKNLESYKTEARGRAILQLLLAELPAAPERHALADLDETLKSRLIPGDFLWESELQPVFPKSNYWFLYGNL